MWLKMKELIQELNEIKGVKNVKKQSGPVLKVNLFGRPVPNSEAVEIKGDLRKISQKLRNCLEEARKEKKISSWEWIIKPEKKYTETSLGRDSITDRKDKGHKPGYYRIAIEMEASST